MYFLDVMIFDPTLTKYMLTDPTKTRLIFSNFCRGEIEHTKIEWSFLWISKKINIVFFYKLSETLFISLHAEISTSECKQLLPVNLFLNYIPLANFVQKSRVPSGSEHVGHFVHLSAPL